MSRAFAFEVQKFTTSGTYMPSTGIQYRFGAGGSGGVSTSNNGSTAGGVGAAVIVIITEYTNQ